jgi:16S rRNA processing protein RimM
VKRVAVGKLTGVFGIRGELKCRAVPAHADALVAGASFALGNAPDARTVRCSGVRRHHERLLVAFDGITTPEDARTIAGSELFADIADAELGRDEYLDADLVGLRLIDPQGREIARVVGVQHFPAQDCLVVDPGGALVPLVKAFVRNVDVAGGTIAVDLPEGLIETV